MSGLYSSADDSPSRSIEIEVTFDVDEATAVPSWLGLAGVASVDLPEERTLDASYFDTAQFALGRCGYALRRRTGGPDEGWHIKGPKDAEGGRLERHWPLDTAFSADGADGLSVPAVLLSALRAVVPEAGDEASLRRIARIRNRRHAYVLRDSRGAAIAEFVDDHVDAHDDIRGVRTRWREWEFELGPAAPGTPEGRAALLRDAQSVALAAGARPAASDSKLARTLGV